MTLRPLSCLSMLACLLASGALHAAVYHVDYVAGDDARDGLTPQTAWKHSPGDAKAAGTVATVVLAPGDTVRFKGGVTYQGSLSLTTSGAAGKPITFDGNLDGTYGSGPAVIDGGEILSGWKRFSSAADVQNNPRWRDLFYVDVPLDIGSNFTPDQLVLHRLAPSDRQAPWQRIIMIDGDRDLLPIAMLPKPSDRFYPDLPKDFYTSPNRIESKDGPSAIVDPTNLTATDADYYRDMFLGVHGGNNHVYFGIVSGFDPAAHRLTFPTFKAETYATTNYAFYNMPRLISDPGEWCIQPVEDKLFRITLLPERLVDGLPANIGFPDLLTGIEIANGASHLTISGFLIQRFSGGAGGISIARGAGGERRGSDEGEGEGGGGNRGGGNAQRSSHIIINDCEIRFVSGRAGIAPSHCDDITIENCYIHHCPSWTTGIFLNRVNRYTVRDCHLVKNSGSGIRHYECKTGQITGTAILEHYGMHANTINIYEGCSDLLLEGNYLHRTVSINRNAERIVFRNNVIDSQGQAPASIRMWTSGRTGGRNITDIHFFSNTFVNIGLDGPISTAIFCQRGASAPTGLIVRDSIVDRLSDMSCTFSGNIYLRDAPKFMGENCVVADNQDALFLDPANGDYRRKPGGPNMSAGASVPPPKEWRGRRGGLCHLSK